MTTLGSNQYHGVFSVLSTPFTDDYRLDLPTLAAEIDWVIGHGVNGVVLAMVSEVFRLADAERDALVVATVATADGRVPVVISVGGESLSQAVRDAGADAVMAVPPMLTRCGADDMRAYFEVILTTFPGPLFIQDASGYIGNSIPVTLQAELYRAHPGRIMFKPEAQPIGQTISDLRQATDADALIFEEMGGLTLSDNYRRGVRGSMPGADIPWATVRPVAGAGGG